jgi:CRISPR-associated protein Cas2
VLHLFLVTYDIADPVRLRKVHKTMKAFGDALQFSVFRCELSEANCVRLKAALSSIIHAVEDQVLVFRLGPLDGTYTLQVEALGRRYDPSRHGALVV